MSQKWAEASQKEEEEEKKEEEEKEEEEEEEKKEEEEDCVLQTNSKFLVHAGFLCDGCVAGKQ